MIYQFCSFSSVPDCYKKATKLFQLLIRVIKATNMGRDRRSRQMNLLKECPKKDTKDFVIREKTWEQQRLLAKALWQGAGLKQSFALNRSLLSSVDPASHTLSILTLRRYNKGHTRLLRQLSADAAK